MVMSRSNVCSAVVMVDGLSSWLLESESIDFEGLLLDGNALINTFLLLTLLLLLLLLLLPRLLLLFVIASS